MKQHDLQLIGLASDHVFDSDIYGYNDVNLNFHELQYKHYFDLGKFIESDFYANVLGREDTTGEYTNQPMGTSVGRDLDTVVANPMDNNTPSECIGGDPDFTFTPMSGFGDTPGGLPGGADSTSIQIDTIYGYKYYIIPFRGYSVTWNDFDRISFYFKSNSPWSVSYEQDILIGEYGENSGQFYLNPSGTNASGDYYHHASPPQYNTTWQQRILNKADFTESGNPSGIINCICFKMPPAGWSPDNVDYIQITGLDITGSDIYGCTDLLADNYNETATVDDGSCIYSNVSPTLNLSYQYISDSDDAFVTLQSYNWNDADFQEIDLNTPFIFNGTDNAIFIDTLGSFDPDGTIDSWDFEIVSGGGLDIFDTTFLDSEDLAMEDNPRVGFIVRIPDLSTTPIEDIVTFTVRIIATDNLLDSSNEEFTFSVYGTMSDEPDEPVEVDTSQLIRNPADIIHHIVKEEVGSTAIINDLDKLNAHNNHKFYDFYGLEETEGMNWRFGFTQHKKINSKKLIEDIAKSSRLFPKFKNNGEFGFNSIRDFYIDLIGSEIKTKDVIDFKFTQTPLSEIYSRVKVLYKKDYADDDLKKDTGWMHFYDIEQYTGEESDFYNYYNMDAQTVDSDGNYSGGQELIFESEYIRDENTAKALRHFLLGWYMNQHNQVSVKLPLSYLGYEIGDVIYFDELLGGIKINGEDYTRKYVLNGNEYITRNGQVIYPMWMITETSKNIDSVNIKAIQLHDWTGSVNFFRGDELPVSFANFTVKNDYGDW